MPPDFRCKMVGITYETGIKTASDCGFIRWMGADKHDLLPSISPYKIKIGLYAFFAAPGRLTRLSRHAC